MSVVLGGARGYVWTDMTQVSGECWHSVDGGGAIPLPTKYHPDSNGFKHGYEMQRSIPLLIGYSLNVNVLETLHLLQL